MDTETQARMLFIEKRLRLENLARTVEGGVERCGGGWETDADQCRIHPYAAMLKIATLMQFATGVSNKTLDAITLECAEAPNKSLDEIFDSGGQAHFLELLKELEGHAQAHPTMQGVRANA